MRRRPEGKELLVVADDNTDAARLIGIQLYACVRHRTREDEERRKELCYQPSRQPIVSSKKPSASVRAPAHIVTPHILGCAAVTDTIKNKVDASCRRLFSFDHHNNVMIDTFTLRRHVYKSRLPSFRYPISWVSRSVNEIRKASARASSKLPVFVVSRCLERDGQ